MGQVTMGNLKQQCVGCCNYKSLNKEKEVSLAHPKPDLDTAYMGKTSEQILNFKTYYKKSKARGGMDDEEIEELQAKAGKVGDQIKDASKNTEEYKKKAEQVKSEAIKKTSIFGKGLFNKGKDKMLTSEQIAETDMLQNMSAKEREAYLKEKALKKAEGHIPDKYRGQYDVAKGLYQSEDKRKAIEGFVPDSYKGSYQTALSSYDKAVDLKKQKDEMQIKMFEKAIDPMWKKFDKKNEGHITQEQFGELGKMALEKVGHGDKYDPAMFDKACKQMVKKDENNPEGHLKKRVVAEMLNFAVFGGL